MIRQFSAVALSMMSAAAFATATLDPDTNILTFNVESGEETYSTALGPTVAGIVKTGAKDLVLQAANTYYGPTKVAAGKLVFEVADGRPLDSSVTVLDGATVDFSGHAQQIPNLGGCGTVANGAVTVTNALVAVFDDLAAGKSLTVSGAFTFAPGAAVDLTGTFSEDNAKTAFRSATTVLTAPGGITGTPTLRVNGAANPYGALVLEPSSDGKSLQLRYAAGTMVIFR